MVLAMDCPRSERPLEPLVPCLDTANTVLPSMLGALAIGIYSTGSSGRPCTSRSGDWTIGILIFFICVFPVLGRSVGNDIEVTPKSTMLYKLVMKANVRSQGLRISSFTPGGRAYERRNSSSLV